MLIRGGERELLLLAEETVVLVVLLDNRVLLIQSSDRLAIHVTAACSRLWKPNIPF